MIAFLQALLAVATLEVATDDTNGTAHYLGDYPLAKCLDGTPGAYAIRAGAEKSKFLIFHQGGGECDSLADCVARANTTLGSTSAFYPPTPGMAPLPHLYGVIEPYFSKSAVHNPLFHNWTHVYVQYCTYCNVVCAIPYLRSLALCTHGPLSIFFRASFLCVTVSLCFRSHPTQAMVGGMQATGWNR